MVPATYVFLDGLPRKANGKVDRKALPAPDADRADLENYVAPRNRTEEVLAGIWAAVLKRERVGIYHNFFELGGESILSIQIIARANQAGLHLTARDLFQHQTIAELAQVAGAAGNAPANQEMYDPREGRSAGWQEADLSAEALDEILSQIDPEEQRDTR
jgi:hypothetical protein